MWLVPFNLRACGFRNHWQHESAAQVDLSGHQHHRSGMWQFIFMHCDAAMFYLKHCPGFQFSPVVVNCLSCWPLSNNKTLPHPIIPPFEFEVCFNPLVCTFTNSNGQNWADFESGFWYLEFATNVWKGIFFVSKGDYKSDLIAEIDWKNNYWKSYQYSKSTWIVWVFLRKILIP